MPTTAALQVRSTKQNIGAMCGLSTPDRLIQVKVPGDFWCSSF